MKELALILGLCLGIPIALIGFLWLLFATLGAMALLGAMITLDLVLLIGLGVIVARHIRGE
jgi:hypothetical protein